jgi:hypothetical protein
MSSLFLFLYRDSILDMVLSGDSEGKKAMKQKHFVTMTLILLLTVLLKHMCLAFIDDGGSLLLHGRGSVDVPFKRLGIIHTIYYPDSRSMLSQSVSPVYGRSLGLLAALPPQVGTWSMFLLPKKKGRDFSDRPVSCPHNQSLM